jgi:putative tryptophan/tyrosine transport system substrate-binding protein
MIRRRDLTIALLGVHALAAPLGAQAQPAKPARVGVLGTSSPETGGYLVDAFTRRLRELGYVEGKNVGFEIRWARGHLERLPELAQELVALNPDVIFTTTGNGALAVRQATTQTPIVFGSSEDPVAGGLAQSLARPGGNATGLSTIGSDTSPKLLEFLLAAVPGLSRLAVLSDPSDATTTAALKNLQTAAQSLNVDVIAFDAADPAEIESGFARMTREHAGAVLVSSATRFFFQRRLIADLALRHRLPSVSAMREITESGGLMSYDRNQAVSSQRAADYVDKILKGAKPGDLPIEKATRLELVINLKTAKALGLTIPQSLLLRADKVIR